MMPTDPVNLLRKLEPPVRPAGAPRSGRAPNAPFEELGFNQMLSLVTDGQVSSGRPISVGSEAMLREELDDAQHARLAAAADVAESAGAGRAVMLIDGRALVMDVAGRAVTGELAAGGSNTVIDVDAAVTVADDTATALPLPPPPIKPEPPRRAG